MKSSKRLLVILVLGVVLLFGLAGNAIAEEVGYELHEMGCGIVCFDFGEWGYCIDNCEEQSCGDREVLPRTTPTWKTPTDTDAPTPTSTDVQGTPTEPIPTATPSPSSVPKCNQGRGNGDDRCSPGNSDQNHNPNDPQGGPRS